MTRSSSSSDPGRLSLAQWQALAALHAARCAWQSADALNAHPAALEALVRRGIALKVIEQHGRPATRSVRRTRPHRAVYGLPSLPWPRSAPYALR